MLGNLLPTEVPEHGPQLAIFMEADPMVYREEFVRAFFKENMPTFAIRVIAEQVKEDNWFEKFLVFLRKVEVVILGVIFNILLEGT